ncbi:hypothetical protein ACFWVF_22630 [Streptomyces sp. NPDC058659]|uniref:hypothetical protein n=1 Tax=unclassified Streptomyces TaxID=2593676 RepID=UPI003657850F
MFVRRTSLEFATEDSPEVLKAAFAEFLHTVGPSRAGATPTRSPSSPGAPCTATGCGPTSPPGA